MKKLTTFALTFSMLILSAQSFAGFRIELHSGKYVVTRHYWEENGWIMFYQLGGQAGYPKSHVREITDTDMPEPVETPGQEPETDKELSQSGDGVNQGDGEIPADLDMDPEEFQAKVEQYQKELRAIHEEIVTLVNRHYSAMRDDLQTVMDETRERIYGLQAKQQELRTKIQNLYGELPEWWFDITEAY